MDGSSWKFYQETLELGKIYQIQYRNISFLTQHFKDGTKKCNKKVEIKTHIGALVDITETHLIFSLSQKFHHCCIVSIQQVMYTPKIVK